MVVALDVSSTVTGWLNILASSNMAPKLVTADVSPSASIGWLKAQAFLNIAAALVHLLVEPSPSSQMGELKALAVPNIETVLTTVLSPVNATGWLNSKLPENMDARVVAVASSNSTASGGCWA